MLRTAQRTSPTQEETSQEEEVPGIADLIPLATELSNRLVTLENTIEDTLDLAPVEQRLTEIESTLAQYTREFKGKSASQEYGADQLNELKAWLE